MSLIGRKIINYDETSITLDNGLKIKTGRKELIKYYILENNLKGE